MLYESSNCDNKSFVLLDSSIDASVKKGLNEPEPKASPPKQDNPAANEKTAPIRR